MKILVTGKNGQVVTAILNSKFASSHQIIAVGRPEMDLAKSEGVIDVIMQIKPDVIISAAAYTAVDKAESEPELAYTINADAIGYLANAAKLLDIPIIHLSTDYVFAGDKQGEYLEKDETDPQSVYGKSKLAGEVLLAQSTPNHVILRTAWVYSQYGNNFLKTMLRLGESSDELNVVDDQIGCPTYAPEIARACIQIAEKVANSKDENLRGIFHLTARGNASWAQFAAQIFKDAQRFGYKSLKVNPIPSSQYPTPAKRPMNSLLSSKKLSEIYSIALDDWQSSTLKCLEEIFNV